MKANADAARAASEEQRLLTEQLAAVEVQWLNALRLDTARALSLMSEPFRVCRVSSLVKQGTQRIDAAARGLCQQDLPGGTSLLKSHACDSVSSFGAC